MKKLQYISILLIAGMFFSCEDYLVKTIEFEEVGYEPVMVVNAKLTSQSDSLLISVTENLNYAENANLDYKFIPDVNLSLTADGQQVGVAEPTNADPNLGGLYNYFIDLQGIDINGRTFELQGSHASYPDISSSIKLPSAGELKDFTFTEEVRTTVVFGYPVIQDEIKFTVEDDPNEENFYYFQIIFESEPDTFIFEQDTFFSEGWTSERETQLEEPGAFQSSYDFFAMISDEGFNGQKKEFTIYSENFGGYGNEGKLRLEYRNLSESDYLFRQSYDRYQNSQDFGIFAEPTTLYNNIEGGLGLFSAEDILLYDIE